MSAIRAEPRTAIMATVEVSWVDHSGTSHDSSATLEDKSVSGACIRIKSPLLVGSILVVTGYREQFTGVTKYCRNERAAYVVGILKDTAESYVAPAVLPTGPAAIAPLRESSAHGVHLVLNPRVQAVPKRQEAAPLERLENRTLPVAVPFMPRPRTAPPALPNRFSPDLESVRVAETQNGLRFVQLPESMAVRGPAFSTQQPPRVTENERTTMPTKWTDLAPWRQKQDGSPDSAATDDAPARKSNGAPTSRTRTSDAAASAADKLSASAESPAPKSLANSQGALLSVEDIYRAAGIMIPRMGYSIRKVADMLASDHLRELSDEMKRASVLMALDAAGISVEEVLHDSDVRQVAVNSYESEQWKNFEDYWALKAAENAHIQSELERVTAQHLERIKRNLDEVAQEKISFASWQTMKQQEVQRIAEAAAVCGRASAAAASAVSPTSSAGVAVTAKQA